MKKNIIFDYDGTLVEFPISFMLEEAQRILKLAGRPSVSSEVLNSAFSDFDFFRFSREGADPLEAEREFKELYWKEFRWNEFPQGKPFPETLETLEELLSLGYCVSIATARVIAPQNLLSEMHACGIGKYFSLETVQTRSSHLDDWKDKTPQIHNLVSSMNISAENSVIVGDIPSDIISGRASKLKLTIAVQSGGIKKEVLEASEPDAVILHLGDLPNLLNDLEFLRKQIKIDLKTVK